MIALAGQEHRQFALQERGELVTRGRILVYVVKDKRAQHDALAGSSLAAFSGKPCLKSLSSLASFALVFAHFLKAFFNGRARHSGPPCQFAIARGSQKGYLSEDKGTLIHRCAMCVVLVGALPPPDGFPLK